MKTGGPNTRERGNRAEGVAADHLAKQGYSIVERNFVCKLGEIDIIARDRDVLVFIEVRSRQSRRTLDPVYSVDRRKQSKIIKAAQVYLASRVRNVPPCRFDVAIVTLMDHPPEVEVIRDAFQLD